MEAHIRCQQVLCNLGAKRRELLVGQNISHSGIYKKLERVVPKIALVVRKTRRRENVLHINTMLTVYINFVCDNRNAYVGLHNT